MAKVSIPQDSGRFTKREADAMRDAHVTKPNVAGSDRVDSRALAFVRSAVSESQRRMRPLHLRWRATYYMLSGNTLDRSGPADVHVPEIYKAIETLVPRIEEAILERDPWFKVHPRSHSDIGIADSVSAYLDWQFDQARVRDLVQPAIRDMLVTQCGVFYTRWENRIRKRVVGKEVQKIDKETGDVKRYIETKEVEDVEFSGPVVELVDPFDFVIDTKATDPQNALFVGHRSYWTLDAVRAMGKQMGWKNISKLKDSNVNKTTFDQETDYYSWSRSPTSRFGENENTYRETAGRPAKLELVTMFGKLDLNDNGQYKDYKMVVCNGVTLEVRENPNESGMRPYATMRSATNGHEFFGIGPFDNAIRLNQHLDRYHAITLRAAEVGACPLVFAQEDSDMPDSLYKVRPFEVLKGTGPVTFSPTPTENLRSAPMIIQMLQRNIEEVCGAFRIQMGQQDVGGGTATEATLSLQEGNRRTRGLIRAVAHGFEQLLRIFYEYNRQFSVSDVEFPVLGKRAFELRSEHASIGPAHFLPDVRFTLYGLKSLHTYGLRATGIQTLVQSMMPLIVNNINNVDQLALLHEFAREMIGPEEADLMIKRPTPIEKIVSQHTENEALISGTKLPVDPEDDDEQHISDMEPLYRAAVDPESKMGEDAKSAVIEHYFRHKYQLADKQARESVMNKRFPGRNVPEGPEAGGINAGKAPPPGGMSNELQALAGGQNQSETPGPPSSERTRSAGRAPGGMSQMNNYRG